METLTHLSFRIYNATHRAIIEAMARPTRAPSFVKNPMMNVIIPTSNAGIKITLPIRKASIFFEIYGRFKIITFAKLFK